MDDAAVSAACHNHMIENPYPHQQSSAAKPASQPAIGFAGFGIAARMVVHKNHLHGPLAQQGRKDVPRLKLD